MFWKKKTTKKTISRYIPESYIEKHNMDMELTFKQLKKHKYLRMKESGGILGFDVIDENGEPPIFEGTLYCMPEILSYPFVEFDD